MAFSPAATRTVCSTGLNRVLRPPTMCSPGLIDWIVTGALPFCSPSTKISTSGSFEMMRRLELVTAPKLAVTFTCWPAGTFTVWRQAGKPSFLTSTT